MIDYYDIDALNWSSLKPMAESAKECRWRQEHPREDTPALLLGRAIHCAVLEKGEFSKRYFINDGSINLRTKAGREERDAKLAEGLEMLTTDQAAVTVMCGSQVWANPDAAALLEGTEREKVITWTMDGVRCKGRLDAVDGPGATLIDLKTTRGLKWFAQDAARGLYHAQLAWYQTGYHFATEHFCRVFIIAVETAEPYDCAVFRLPPYVLEAGRALYQKLLDRWKACRERDEWPGRHRGIVDLELPQWAPGMEGEEGF